MSKYSITYNERLSVMDMEEAINDIDARIAALESQAKPAPEASGPTSKTNVEPSASLYLYHITYGEHAEIKEVHLATKPEVRAEAVRLGLLDTERQKVAGALYVALMKGYEAMSLGLLADYNNEAYRMRNAATILIANGATGLASELMSIVLVLEAATKQDADSLEQRVRDLECEVESLFAFQRRDHPATRPVVKKTPVPPDFTPEEMGYEPDVKLAPNKHNCPCCGGPVTIEGDGSTHWYKPQPAPVAEPTETESEILFIRAPRPLNEALFVQIWSETTNSRDDRKEYQCTYQGANDAQIIAAAERLGMAMPTRARAAEAFLEAARVDSNGEYTYQQLADWLRLVSRMLSCEDTKSVINAMAAVLSDAAKGEG